MSDNNQELMRVASKMAAANTMAFDSTCGITARAWDQISERITQAAKRMFLTQAGCSKEDMLAYVIQSALRGETPESVAMDFAHAESLGLDAAEKKCIIWTLIGKQRSADFAPLPIGTAAEMLQNIFGHWFKLAGARSRRELYLHARAHMAGAKEMFRRRDEFYEFRGWHEDGARTQTRHEALARLEMEEILSLGLSGEQLLNFFVWWTTTGEVSVSRQLADKYPDHKAASQDAGAVLMRQIRGPELHNETAYALRYHGVPLYYLRGVCVPGSLITMPACDIDPRAVLSCPNPAIRKELVKKISLARMLTAVGDIIDEIGEYQLWGLSFPDRDIRVLRIESRLSEHAEGEQPPAWWEGVLNTCQTVKDALTFRNGTDRLPSFIT
jgi:hypothetical protein